MQNMKVTFPGGKRVDVEYKGFVIETDQPVYAGGEGRAPAPFDLFLASIAACSGLYLLVFCQNRSIPLDGASVEMRIHKNEEKKMIDKIDIELYLPPEFPEKYEKAVIRSVDSCAVKDHIVEAPRFEIIVKR